MGNEKPLSCPECEGKVGWNGLEYCCLSCSWTEHKAKPPSSSIIIVPKRPDDPSKNDVKK